MEILEKVFQKIWISMWPRSKSMAESGTFESLQRSLGVFSEAVLHPSFQPHVLSSHDFVGLRGTSLFLPELRINTKDTHFIRTLYINLILQISAAHNLNLRASPAALSLGAQSRWLYLQSIHKVNSAIDSEFPGYKEFQTNFILELQRKTVGQFSDRTSELLLQAYLRREPSADILSFDFSRNGPGSDFIFYSTPCLELDELPVTVPMQTARGLSPQTKTERKKQQTGNVESVDFQKERSQPVAHSFEKLETADEYQGGYKFDCGADDLKDHSEALEEVSLSKVTRGGEAAQSVYRDEGSWILLQSSDQDSKRSRKGFFYPEWHFKKASYLKNHCQLFENPLSLQIGGGADYLERLKKEHRHHLVEWQKKMQMLVNSPLWISRLKDGDEIDLDSFTKDLPIIKKQNVDGRWYAHKKKCLQDFSVFVLFDQSLSSDSWVGNQRVLDVIVDSIGMMGLLFEHLIPDVQVAGTWSQTRHKCRFQTYKTENDLWERYFEGAGNIEPQGYTRLGPAIRHATKIMEKNINQRKFLLLLTDGKPTDIDGYEGSYGVQDVKRACLEAEAKGVFLHALTVDHEARLYFPKMFRHYSLLPHPKKLPEELFRIFSQLLGRSLF